MPFSRVLATPAPPGTPRSANLATRTHDGNAVVEGCRRGLRQRLSHPQRNTADTTGPALWQPLPSGLDGYELT